MFVSAIQGKRDGLARLMYWSGGAFLASRLRERDSLVVLNYHSIGDFEAALFDPAVYSATADQFYEQVSYLKRSVGMVTLEEALDFIERPSRHGPGRCRVLLTFDDGYLDNHQVAFPILKSFGVQGVFFLTTGMVGTASTPWWDRIAHIVKSAVHRRFVLSYPSPLRVDLDGSGFRASLREVLQHCKRPDSPDVERFIAELAAESGGSDTAEATRRFLGWADAREMLQGGMAIGSHTHSHAVLSQLNPDRQWQELAESRVLLKQHLGIDADTLSYPVGNTSSFTEQTQSLVERAGYRAAFSFYGGPNLPGATRRYDVRRFSVSPCNHTRFRVQVSTARFNGRMWP